MTRPDWDDYFLGIALAVARRGECVRSKVGAVIVRDRRILATGYNGVAPGTLSCLDGVCPRAHSNVPPGSAYSGRGACIATHAEENAIRDALNRGLAVAGAQIYITKEPCELCASLLETHQLSAVWTIHDNTEKNS